jgi:hypothetical protein
MTNSFGPRGRSRRSDEEIIPWVEKWKAAPEARKRQMQNSLAIRLRRRVTIQSTQGASRNLSVRGAGRQSVEKTEELIDARVDMNTGDLHNWSAVIET